MKNKQMARFECGKFPPQKYWILLFLAIVVRFMCFPDTTAGDWTINRRADLRNQDGNNLRFDTYHGGSIQAWLILRKITRGVFESKLPIYQVDNNRVRDLQEFSKIATDMEKQRWVRWEISKSN